MPVAQMFLFAQLRKCVIDFAARDWAALDIDQTMRVAAKKTDHLVLRMHGNAVAISVLPRRRNYRTHGNILQFADPLERVAHLSPFYRKLVFVADMLICAAAASAKISALWRHAIRRTLLNVDQFRFGELFLFAHDFGRNDFALNRVRNKHSLTLLPRHTFPTKSDVLYFQIDQAHIINTLLQLVVSDNDIGIKLL